MWIVSGFAPFLDLLPPHKPLLDSLFSCIHAWTHTHNLGLMVSLAISVLAIPIYWLNGCYFNVILSLPLSYLFLYLISSFILSLPLSYLFLYLISSFILSLPLSYHSFLLFRVWMVTPATPSHSVLVPPSVPNTGRHGLCAGLCADHLGIYGRVLTHVFARLNLTDSPAL